MTKTKKTITKPATNQPLTDPEKAVLNIVKKRCAKGLTTWNKDIVAEWKKNRIYVCRILNRLIEKGLVERYSSFYYRIPVQE